MIYQNIQKNINYIVQKTKQNMESLKMKWKEYIGLRSKLYSFKYEDAYDENNQDCNLVHLRDLLWNIIQKKMGEGIKMCVINSIKFDDYGNALLKHNLTEEMNFKIKAA